MKKYYIITYGCQMNKSDSERIATILEDGGYGKASNITGADLIVVNMCSVRQSAVNRVYGLLPKFKKWENKNLKTILTGCILKKDFKKFKEHFDSILPIKTLAEWPKILNIEGEQVTYGARKEKYFYYPDPRSEKFNEKFSADYFRFLSKYSNNFSAFIPISTGCNNFCAFCVVPFTRGPLICRNHKEILKEVKNVIQKGFKEIWLLGQNVNDYQSPIDPSVDFPELLKEAYNIKGYFWIRFTSSHPKDLSDKLIDVMTNCKKVTEYLNLPVQSGDNQVLKKMNRPYTIEQYKALVKKIRRKILNITLSTDVIVGFPGETKEQFENTLSLFKEIKYDMAYIAKYSPRQQTAAFKLKDNVSYKEKERRYKILTEILKKTASEKNKRYIGKTVEVLVDTVKNGFLIGKTRNYKTVKFEGSKNLIGQFIKVKIKNIFPWGLKGLTNFQ